jgi:hypothetical protein
MFFLLGYPAMRPNVEGHPFQVRANGNVYWQGRVVALSSLFGIAQMLGCRIVRPRPNLHVTASYPTPCVWCRRDVWRGCVRLQPTNHGQEQVAQTEYISYPQDMRLIRAQGNTV